MSLARILTAMKDRIEQEGDPLLKAIYVREYVSEFEFALNGEAHEHYAFAALHCEGIVNRLGADYDPKVLAEVKKLALQYRKRAKPQNLTSAPPSTNP